MGLGYEDVKAINPSVIYCSISGFGRDGPYKLAPGYDAIIGGEAGLLYACVSLYASDDRPTRPAARANRTETRSSLAARSPTVRPA
jgi:crotonobetainyl-CoA:carnitine CoA-transferase CaiB-like acyl-CoA transferase